MNVQGTSRYYRRVTPGATLPMLRSSGRAERVGARGITLFLIGAALAGSSFASARLEVGSFLVHPMVLLVGLVLLAYAPRQLHRFPPALGRALLLFVGAFGVSMLFDSLFFYQLLIKLATAAVTIVAVSLLVKRESEYTSGVTGMVVGVSVMALHGILTSNIGSETFSPMEGTTGNKNSFSLYAIPALLLGGDLLIRRSGALWARISIGIASVVIVTTVFSSANRSGWVGVAIAGFALVVSQKERRWSGLVIVALLAVGTVFLLNKYLDTGVFERRLDQTFDGYKSDELRQELLIQCFLIGLDHPFLGLGPFDINFELARRVRSVSMDVVGPHNAITFLFGAGGLVLFGAWLHLGVRLWRFGSPAPGEGRFSILQLLIVLWLSRGLFTDEVLYSPAFAFSFGLAVGLSMLRMDPRSPFLPPLALAPPRVI